MRFEGHWQSCKQQGCSCTTFGTSCGPAWKVHMLHNRSLDPVRCASHDWRCTADFYWCWQDQRLPSYNFLCLAEPGEPLVSHVRIRCSRYLWTLMDKLFISWWAVDKKKWSTCCNKSKHKALNKHWFWFGDNRNLTSSRDHPSLTHWNKKPLWPGNSHF